MGSAATGALRLARAWVAVALTLGLAGLGHAVGGGSLTSPALLVLVVLLTPLALAATRVRWTVGRAAAGLGAGQVLVHVLLTAMAPAHDGYAAPAHLAHGSALPAGWSATTGTGIVAGHTATGLTAGMIAAHVVATLVTALLVGFAEKALWAVLARLLPTPVIAATCSPASPRAAAGWAPRRLHGIPVGAVAGRGPPVGLRPTAA